ncbi:MAG: selenocysteine-specific translation elongation factor [Bacillota bacterium]
MKQKNIIVGTAGHIDHGKTTLIGALTGADTDRLKEEKERGISIDLGFTGFDLSDEIHAGIIDVPGHEKFIKNMLAGAAGVDLALLVIAADEGIMPQTREHLAILELLQVKYGVVAITKADKVESDWLELVVEDAREQLGDSFLKDAPFVPVSAIVGTGLDKLEEALLEEAKKIPGKDESSNVYLPIDRVFTMSGFGTVITGTLVSGTLETGSQMLIYPDKDEARIRSIQVHNEKVEAAYPGERTGVNLAGIDKEDIERGDVLATPGSLIATSRLDGRVKLLPSSPMVLENDTRIRFHIGAREVLGRAYLIDKEEILPGESGLVQFRLEETIVSRFKENFVIRRYSPMITIGGGKVLENSPPRRKHHDSAAIEELKIKESGTPAERVELTLRLAGRPLRIDDLIEKTGLSEAEINNLLQELIASGQVYELAKYQKPGYLAAEPKEAVLNEMVEITKKYHQKQPLRPGISRAELRSSLSVELNTNEFNQLAEELEEAGKLELSQKYIKEAGFQVEFTGRAAEIKEGALKLFAENKFSPPEVPDLAEALNENDQKLIREVIGALEEEGILIRLTEDLYFTEEAVAEAEKMIKEFFLQNESLELSQFRDIIGSSRKYALPLLEYFDEQGLTYREGDKRYLK